MVDRSETDAHAIRVARTFVGSVTGSLADCEREDRATPIDVAIARRQHRLYVDVLETEISRVDSVACADAHPDAVFVEDTVVVLDASRAVLTRPGAASRRDEVAAVAATLAPTMSLLRMEAPATLDGGDVLRVGSVLLVGISTRTNQAGARLLAAAAREADLRTEVVPVPRGLHLKSACSLADEQTLVYDSRAGLDLGPFRALGLSCLAAGERAGANVLALGRGRVLVSASAPGTRALLAERGLRVSSVPMSELHKADGALTCCSIRVPEVGGWCT